MGIAFFSAALWADALSVPFSNSFEFEDLIKTVIYAS